MKLAPGLELPLDAITQTFGMSGNSGTFDTYLSRLRRLQLIDGKTELRASAEFFA